MKREEFTAMETAYFTAKHKAGHMWTTYEITQTEAVIADMRKHLCPPPKPVPVDPLTLQEAIDSLEACDGYSIRTQQVISALTKAIEGATS